MSMMLTHFLWALCMPSTWLVIGMFWALLALRSKKLLRCERILWVWLLFASVITIYPLGNWLLDPLESAYPLNPSLQSPEWLILLGGGEDIKQTTAKQQLHLSPLGTRYITLLTLAKRYPQAKIIVSGGVGHMRQVTMTEAQLARKILLLGGIAPQRIIMEDKSHNTIENAQFTRNIILNQGAAADEVVLITSAAHMPRAMGLFCGVGMTHITPYPTGFLHTQYISLNLPEHLLKLNFSVHEWLGLLKNWLLGYAPNLWVKAC